MRAGQLRHRITLLTPSANEWGELTEWNPFHTVAAEVNDDGGELIDPHGAVIAKRSLTIIMRPMTLPEPLRIEWLKKQYTVIHVARDRKLKQLTLTAVSEQ